MNRKRRYLHEWSTSVPVFALKGFSVFHDDFSRQREITIEPGPPQTTTIYHNVHLVVTSSINLASRGYLKYGTVGVTAYNFEGLHRLSAALFSSQKRADRRTISGEIVALASLDAPMFVLLDFSEPVGCKCVFAVVNCMEVA